MNMVARAGSKPCPHLGVLMGGVVINNQMNVQISGHIVVNMSEKGQKLLMSVPGFALREDFAGGDVKRRKQGGGAVADVVVRNPFDVSEPHRQHRLGPVQCLDLALLINRQHKGSVRRVQVQPHDITHLLHKERIGGQFEGFRAVRLQSKHPEKPVRHRGCHPVSAANPRTLQWVPSLGFVCRALVIRAATSSSSRPRGLPERSSSCSPCKRLARKRFLHVPTVEGVTPRRVAIVAFGTPSAASNTILARRTRPAGRLRDRTMLCSCSRSSVLKVSGARGRPVFIGYPPMVQDTQNRCNSYAKNL